MYTKKSMGTGTSSSLKPKLVLKFSGFNEYGFMDETKDSTPMSISFSKISIFEFNSLTNASSIN
jgi:hypothetical protein